MRNVISEADFIEAAKVLGCEVAAIKAVAEVESKGDGFTTTGEPTVLFEPHVFYKELEKAGMEPASLMAKHKDLINPKWGAIPYGKFSEQHGKLSRAVTIHREAALQSASWGTFQVMGNNWKLCGYPTLQDFINDAYRNAGGHLKMFVGFVKGAGLTKHLVTKNWAAFARGYNGSGYEKNAYHTKMATAYKKHST